MIPFNFKTYDKNVMFIDIETVGKVDSPIMYDLSITIKSIKTGKVLYKMCFIVANIFNDKDTMTSPFYTKANDKFYRHKLGHSKLYQMKPNFEIAEIVNQLIKDYGITTMIAYNCKFDRLGVDLFYERANETLELDKVDKVIPNLVKKLVLVDLWQWVYETMGKSQVYKDWCKANNFVTKKGTNYMSNVETVYKFISKDLDFIERHTGLEDLVAEMKIFDALRKVNPRIKPNLLGGGHNFFRGCLLRTDLA